MIAIRDGVLARERTAAAHVAEVLEVDLAPLDGGHASAKHRHQAGRADARVLPFAQQRLDAFRLIALNVDDEHVGAATVHADGELRDQVALQCAHPEHEEAAESNRQEDHPRLIARTAKADHRVT